MTNGDRAHDPYQPPRNGDEAGGKRTDKHAHDRDIEKLPQRRQPQQRHQERRIRAEYRPCYGGRGDGGQDHRDESGDRVLHHDHFHGEHDPSQWRIERSRDGGRCATGNQRPDAVVWQHQLVPEEACGAGPEMNTRRLAADRVAAGQRHHAAEKLHQNISQRHMSLVVMQAFEHMHDAHRPACRLQSPIDDGEQHSAQHRQQETHPWCQMLERVGRALT